MFSSFAFLKKLALPSAAFLGVMSLYSCSSSRPYYDIDGVYTSTPVYRNDTNEHNLYYESYFKEKGQDADLYVTDIDQYSSYNASNYSNFGAEDTSTTLYLYTDMFWGFNNYMGWGWNYGWGYPYSGWYGAWGYPYYGYYGYYGYPYYSRNTSYSPYRQPMSRSVTAARGTQRNLQSRTLNEQRMVPRKTFSAPSRTISTFGPDESRFSDRRSTNFNNDSSSNSRTSNQGIQRSRGTINTGRSVETPSTPRMSSGSSRGFGGGGSAPMRSSGRR